MNNAALATALPNVYRAQKAIIVEVCRSGIIVIVDALTLMEKPLYRVSLMINAVYPVPPTPTFPSLIIGVRQ